MPDTLVDIEKTAIKLATEVGERVRKVLDGREAMEVSFKAENDVVTDIDVWAEDFITQGIETSFSDHQVLGEETSWADSLDKENYQKGYCWIIDPIDGTSNFVNRIPHVAVSIGILHNGERKVGVIYDTARDIIYSAIKNKGATASGKPIKAAKSKEIKKSLIAMGYPHSRIKDWPELEPAYKAFFESARDVRTLGSAALEQCWVASGKLEAYFEMGLRPWDVAAGSLIVEEAGGCVGNPLENKKPGRFSCFSPSYLFGCTEDIYSFISSKLPS